MNEVEFVKFQKCVICKLSTEEFCVSCEEWFCRMPVTCCVICEQAVCKGCYEEDKCCLVRPWGEKTELSLRDFYQNKLVGETAIRVVENDGRYGNEHRKEALKRSIARFIDTYDHEALSWCKPQTLRDFFPSITQYVENAESRLKFVQFMENLFHQNDTAFANLFLNSDLREDLFSLMEDMIRSPSSKAMQRHLVRYSLLSKELFDLMKSRGLLHWSMVDESHYYHIGHFDAYEWICENGIDVIHNEEHFKHFEGESSAEMMEYLIVEKGMTVEFMTKNINSLLEHQTLKMIYRVKGMKSIETIAPEIFDYDFETLKFLKFIGYKLDNKIRNSPLWLYSLICLNMMNYEDLDEEERETFDQYVRNYDIKVCKHMYPFMKKIRKRKIMTLILCIRKTYPRFQKEIIWKILDLAYSPKDERGI